jgi:hypothetical protein
MKRLFLAMLMVSPLSLAPSLALAQEMLPSFSLIGEIESFKLEVPGDPATAPKTAKATIRVSNTDVTLPQNLLITMPGRYATAQELFAERIDLTQTGSGLALDDPNPPTIAFEAELTGNIVNGEFIAGIASISQGALHTGAGFIQAIDYATGEMRIGAKDGTTGARIILNDETGVFGLANGVASRTAYKLDPRFALDPENAPVHAKTGFPVCVPRNSASGDTACPANNRPGDASRNRFTCTKTNAAAASDVPAHPCDPALPAPLLAGDYVTYAGILQKHPAGGFVIAAYELDAEIGIYTSPGADPAYVFVEEAIQGTKGERFANVPQEETTRFRIVGFTTDPTRDVTIRIADSDRNGHSFTFANLTPRNTAPLGRFTNTWPSKDNARAVRRDVEVAIVGSSNDVLPSGLTSGFYTAPVAEYIYPEVTSFGVPGFPSPVSFENFCFLTNAGGKYPDPAAGPTVLATLSPFPNSGHALSQEIGAGPERVCDSH